MRAAAKRGEAGSHHQLTFLADVHEPGAAVDDRAQRHEQDRRGDADREPDPAAVEDADPSSIAVNTAVHEPPVTATSSAASASAVPMHMA